MGANNLVSDELTHFLESGLSIVLATRDGDLEPDGAAAWAVQVGDRRNCVTVYLYVDAAQRMLRNLAKWPEIAIDLDQPTTHRACQLKGRYLSSRPARADERERVDSQVRSFERDLEAIGIPRAMFAGWKTWPCTALEIEVTELFEQTPGPGAGERLR